MTTTTPIRGDSKIDILAAGRSTHKFLGWLDNSDLNLEDINHRRTRAYCCIQLHRLDEAKTILTEAIKEGENSDTKWVQRLIKEMKTVRGFLDEDPEQAGAFVENLVRSSRVALGFNTATDDT